MLVSLLIAVWIAEKMLPGIVTLVYVPYVVIVSIVVSLGVLFWFSYLETEVRTDGIYYRLFPFHISFKNIPCSQIRTFGGIHLTGLGAASCGRV